MKKRDFSNIALGLGSVFLLLTLINIPIENANGQAASTTDSTGVSITICDGGCITSGGGHSSVTSNLPAKVLFQGFTAPNSIITILRNGSIAGTFTSKDSGEFSNEISVTKGFITFGIWAKDNTGLLTKTTNITINLGSNSSAQISNIFLSPTISANRSLAESGTKVKIFGSTYPNSIIRIFNNLSERSSPEATVQADGNGSWTYLINTLALSDGEYSYKVNSQNTDPSRSTTLISPFSEDITFSIGEVLCSGADFNDDGGVNISDFSIMLFYWGPLRDPASLTNLCVDLNKDERINIFDFSVLMYEWTG